MAKNVRVLETFIVCHLVLNSVETSMNIALHKTTSQSSMWVKNRYLSENAVDGITDQRLNSESCTHTNAKQKSAWWQVDLGSTSEIRRIQIFYRKEDGDNSLHLKRLNGYSIHIDSQLCYEDPVDVLPSALTVQHNCSFQGRYVNMSIESNPEESNPIITLCEFEVYGCSVGHYGNNSCDMPCSSGCNNSSCNPDDGTCTCLAEWRGDKCTEHFCPSGQYGNPCQPCSSECLKGVCDDYDGHCNEGCKPGSHGSHCDQPCHINCADGTCNQDNGYCTGCVSGYYNTDCNSKCPKGCKDDICDQNGGNCIECNGHFTGGKCAECRAGYYGTKSCQPCPSRCFNNTCNSSDGYCTGCQNTFYGSHCDLKCPLKCTTEVCERNSGSCIGCETGFHGTHCNLTCFVNCNNGTCDQLTGNCDSGCTDGFHGPDCHSRCSKRCKTDRCYQNDGSCVDGCIVGFTGDKCTECVTGKHGEHCNKSCPTDCKENACSRNNGTCVSGCIHENMQGSTCNECITGYFGQNCTSRCPKNCDDCEKKTGHCFSCPGNHYGPTCKDCQKGYYGLSCQNICSNFCRGVECDARIGYCIKGCIDGKYGIFCNWTCSTNCTLHQCHQINGECEHIRSVTYECTLRNVLSCSRFQVHKQSFKPMTIGSPTRRAKNCRLSRRICMHDDEIVRTVRMDSEVLEASSTITSLNMAGPVVGSIFATLIFVGVVLAAIYLIRRFRTKQKSSNYEDTTRRSGEYDTEQKYEGIKQPNIYTNDVFYGSSSSAAESPEQDSGIAENYEIVEVQNSSTN